MLEETYDKPELDLAFLILNHVLLETPASPLRKALIDSGLGEELENGIDPDDELLQKCFSAGLRGVKSADGEKVEPLVLATIWRLIKDGIDPKTLAASRSTIEFRLREIKDFTADSHLLPGLWLMVRALGAWLHGGDPIDRIAFEQPLEKIKAELKKNSRYFEDLIQKYLLDNPHRTTVTLTPDANFAKEKKKRKKRN